MDTDSVYTAPDAGVMVIERTIPNFLRGVPTAAKRAGCSASTIYRAIASGDLEAHQPTGPKGGIFFEYSVLDAWVQSRQKAVA